MKTFRLFFVLLLTFGVLALPIASLASGVQDPGFSYVDVNNDGLYNAADGDIPVSAQVATGTFDTSVCVSGYTPPFCPAGLVISKSQVITSGVAICLKAGVNLTVLSNLNDTTTPTIVLNACATVCLANTAVAFQNQLNVNAGCDVIIDGTLIDGIAACSKVYLYAGGNLSGHLYASGPPFYTTTSTNITAGTLIDTFSCGNTCFDGSDIATTQSGGAIELEANGSVQVVDEANIFADAGPVEIESNLCFVQVQESDVTGATLDVDAFAAATLDGSILNTTGATTINAGGPVYGRTSGIPLIVGSSCFTVCSLDCVDLDTSNLYAGAGTINVSGTGTVTANSASWTATTGISVHSTLGCIDARTAYMDVVTAHGPIGFFAGGLLIDVTGSTLIGHITYSPFLLVRVVGP